MLVDHAAVADDHRGRRHPAQLGQRGVDGAGLVEIIDVEDADDLSARRLGRLVHRIRLAAIRAGNQAQARMALAQGLHQLDRAIRGAAIDDDVFEDLVALGLHVRDALLDEAPAVERRRDDRDLQDIPLGTLDNSP